MYLLPQRGICTSLRRLFVFGSRVHVLCLPARGPRPNSMRIFSCVRESTEQSRDARVVRHAATETDKELSIHRTPTHTSRRVALTNTHSAHVFRSPRVCKSGRGDVRGFSPVACRELRARVGRCAPARGAPCAVCAERSGAFLQAASGSQRSAPRLRRGVCVAAKPGAHLAAKPP